MTTTTTRRTSDEFVSFLTSTLIPDLKASGNDCTAEDFEEAIAWISHWKNLAALRLATSSKPRYANLRGYSDVQPYEVVRWVSEKTAEIRLMKSTLDPSWKREVAPGGFAGHTENNSAQRWVIESEPANPIIKMRLGKKGWKSALGTHVLSDQPSRFYDFNY